VPALGYTIYTSYLAYKNMPRKTVIVKISPSYQARANHFLAGQELLEGRDVPVTSVTGVPFNLEKNDTMFLDTARETVGKTQSRRLLDWIKAGGHLIVTPPGEDVKTDHLFEALGVYSGEDHFEERMGIEMPGVDRTLMVKFEFLDRGPKAVSAYDKNKRDPDLKAYAYRPVVSDEREGLVESGPVEAPFYSAWPLGQGRVTVLGDARFLYNDQIDQADHMLIFWNLATVNREGDSGMVWLIRQDEIPPLYIWIWNKASHLVLAGLLILMVWMWSASRRLGPIQQEQGLDRRRLMEHIEASAIFYWRSGQGQVLVASVRDAVGRQISRRCPQWNHIEKEELYQNLAELTKLSLAEVKVAMTASQYREANQVKRCIMHLEQIRREL